MITIPCSVAASVLHTSAAERAPTASLQRPCGTLPSRPRTYHPHRSAPHGSRQQTLSSCGWHLRVSGLNLRIRHRPSAHVGSADPRQEVCTEVSSEGARQKAHEALLSEALHLSATELWPWAEAQKLRLSLSFLTWLAEREDEASGDARAQLGVLGGQLMAVREGLVPLDQDVLDAELAAAAAQLGSGRSDDSGNGLVKGGEGLSSAEAAAIAKRRVALTFSRETALSTEKQVADLEEGVKAMRLESSIALIGRQQLAAEDVPASAAGFATADAAGRIMNVLLVEPDRGERAAMLQDAFTPPSISPLPQVGVEELGDELLFTSPLRLLLAIDGELSARSTSGGGVPTPVEGNQLTGRVSGEVTGEVSPAERRRRLQELRADVQAVWDDEVATDSLSDSG